MVFASRSCWRLRSCSRWCIADAGVVFQQPTGLLLRIVARGDDKVLSVNFDARTAQFPQEVRKRRTTLTLHALCVFPGRLMR